MERQRVIYFNRVEDGSKNVSYVPQSVVADIVRCGHAVQWWRVLGKTVSCKLKRGGMVKRYENLAHHVVQGEDVFLTLLEECERVGVKRPSSYSDIFSQRFKTPRILHTWNALLAPGFAGGWQEGLVLGTHPQRLRRYDLNSAYLWGLLSAGLPNQHTFYFLRDYEPTATAVYLVYTPDNHIHTNGKRLPYPFSVRDRFALASHLEMMAYGIDPALVVYGIAWRGTMEQERIAGIIETCPARKQVSRTYWGRWASRRGVECHTVNKSWGLRNPTRNLIWAHWIVSTVRLRLWEATHKPLHVFVDSVITDEELPTGENPGDWRLENTYENGLVILGAGLYGQPGCDLEKHAGRKDGKVC